MMPDDFEDLAKKTVAIQFRNGSPALLRPAYPDPMQWASMVRSVKLNAQDVVLIEDGSEEAEAILQENGYSGLTYEGLMAEDINFLRQKALSLNLSGGGGKDALAKRILEATSAPAADED